MIEFQGRFDESVANSLNNHAMKKLRWLFILIPALLIVFGILGIVFREDSEDLFFGVYLIVFGVIFTPLCLLFTKLLQKNLNKMSIMSGETLQTFQFLPDRLVITQRKGDEYDAVTNARYSYLYRVEETANNYFLQISKTQSHVVNKVDLTQGTIEELNQILYANLGQKFKPWKK